MNRLSPDRGKALTEAKILSAKPGFRHRLDPVRDYLQASRRREDDRIATLRKRSRILVALLVVTAIVATAAVYGFVTATKARNEADARFRDATSFRLISEAEPVLAGSRSGSAVSAYQRLLAARRLAQTPDDGPLVNALVKTVNLIKIADAGSIVSSVVFSPDGTRLATGGSDDTVRLWDPATGQLVGQPLTGHTEGVTSVTFSPDGKRLASGGFDGAVRMWDPSSEKPVGDPLTGHTGPVNSVAFSPDGKHLATAGSVDKTLRTVAGVPRPRLGDVRQAHRQHEPSAVARLGLTRHRLHQGLPGTANPGRCLKIDRSGIHGTAGDRTALSGRSIRPALVAP